ncbi:hypothetical protein CNEO4_800002 [Clostridium neonatale]|nr:hypothetical protein CNEO3_1260002 [Clostridium neonatale]CAI3550207.1 hypothetical protein CNEO3_1040002 [Clostridium neonatale]CAI3551915.1 hypothetical protein CNEO3_1030002 [Clostridium neonatale]CAI3720088.1 hypothetical protein CNEO4_800002 [Clostridium neonatale]
MQTRNFLNYIGIYLYIILILVYILFIKFKLNCLVLKYKLVDRFLIF